jgi:RNA polymerase sigma-70 factor (ECF subfamily)
VDSRATPGTRISWYVTGVPADSDTTALLGRARSGSEEALNALFTRCAARTLTLVRLRLGGRLRERVESRDILQTALLKAFQGLGRFRGENGAAFTAWLARIAENEVRDQADYHGRRRRDQAREVALDDPMLERVPADARSLTSRLVLDERLVRLATALESLSDDHRAVVVGRFLEEQSFEELGKNLKRSPDACRMLLARALAALTWRMREP